MRPANNLVSLSVYDNVEFIVFVAQQLPIALKLQSFIGIRKHSVEKCVIFAQSFVAPMLILPE